MSWIEEAKAEVDRAMGKRIHGGHLTLDDYDKKATELTGGKCPDCGGVLGYIEHYDHDGGWDVESFPRKQWLYKTCRKCGYQWALWKLGIPRSSESAGGKQEEYLPVELSDLYEVQKDLSLMIQKAIERRETVETSPVLQNVMNLRDEIRRRLRERGYVGYF